MWLFCIIIMVFVSFPSPSPSAICFILPRTLGTNFCSFSTSLHLACLCWPLFRCSALDSQDLCGLHGSCCRRGILPLPLPLHLPLPLPLPGVDVPDVLQSPSASLNKITARHVMNCSHFCNWRATLLSGKHLTRLEQQLRPSYQAQTSQLTVQIKINNTIPNKDNSFPYPTNINTITNTRTYM